MPESAGSYVSKNKYLISLYTFHYTLSGLAEKTASRKSFYFNRLESLAYNPDSPVSDPLLRKPEIAGAPPLSIHSDCGLLIADNKFIEHAPIDC
jgi:hypothetical protein